MTRLHVLALVLVAGWAGLATSTAADVVQVPAGSKGAPAPVEQSDPFASRAAPAVRRADPPPLPHQPPPDGAKLKRLPPPPPPHPQPAPEIAALGKQLAGKWTCKGVSMKGDGSSTPLLATVTSKLDLDDSWIVTSLVETKGTLKWTQYTAFDATAKQWTRVQLVNTSAHVFATSLGEKDGKWTWEGTETSPSGTQQVRDYEQRDPKQLKVWGEALLSGSWQKLYEATCKK